MKKFIFFLMFSLIFLGTNNVYAHTGLESSSPANGETIKEELEQITLTFETKIEQGSKLILLDSAGNEVELESMEVADNKLIGILPSPLESNGYEVQWDIIGADGHVIEGEYTFTVNVPDVEAGNENQENTEEEVVEDSTEEVAQKDSQEEVDHSQHSAAEHAAYLAENNDPSAVLVPAISILVGIILAIIIAGFIIMRKKKK